MAIAICLLRGINVSGQKPLKMTELTEMFLRMGSTKVQTYIQSGNVVFELGEFDTMHWANQIKAEITKTFSYDIPVWVFDVATWRAVINQNPFKSQSEALDRCYISLFDKEPSKERKDVLAAINLLPDQVHLVEKSGYIWIANRFSDSKVSNNFLESKLRVTATTRNLKTMYTLLDLAEKMA